MVKRKACVVVKKEEEVKIGEVMKGKAGEVVKKGRVVKGKAGEVVKKGRR